MPRKDRRFTPEDIARLYCKRLSEGQQQMALMYMQSCEEDLTDNELLALFIRYIADFAATINAPGMQLISGALKVLADAVEIEHTQAEIEDYLSFIGEGS